MRTSPYLPDLEIGTSFWRMLGILLGGVGLTLASAAIVFDWYPDHEKMGTSMIALGYFGMVFFGAATCKIGWSLLSSTGPVLFITSQGIRDARTSTEFTPWQSVEAISLREVSHQKFVVLTLSPGSQPVGAWAAINNALGFGGMTISTAGLTVSADELLETCETYRAAAPAMTATRPATVRPTQARVQFGRRG